MVVKASPASSFIVIEAEFLLEFLIVALDPPAHFGGCDELLEVGVGRQGRKPVFGRCAFALRPFDEQPFFGIGLRAPIVPMRGPHAQAGKPGTQGFEPRRVCWRLQLLRGWSYGQENDNSPFFT